MNIKSKEKSRMKLLIIGMSLVSFFLGSCEKRAAKQPAPAPALPKSSTRGWIRVLHGTPEQIKQAILAHADLTKNVEPQDFSVVIIHQPSGFQAVTFPDGIPPWEFVNLIGWLNHPQKNSTVSGAAGWLTSSGTGLHYSLQPEAGNRWGDTLIGRSSDGSSVQVYIPDATMCALSRHIEPLPEPVLAPAAGATALSFTVTLDVDRSFGNPDFKITHPRDNNWNK